MTLCDSNVLVCLASPKEPKADECRKIADSIGRPLITTWPCIAESMHLLGSRAASRESKWQKQKIVARMLQKNFIAIYKIEPSDHQRLFDLMEQYQDRPMDLADASLVYTAEKTGESKILTLDSDFLIYRINNRGRFEVLTSRLLYKPA